MDKVIELIGNTIRWTVIMFAVFAGVYYVTGADDWMTRTLDCVVPLAIGYFTGYGDSLKNKNR